MQACSSVANNRQRDGRVTVGTCDVAWLCECDAITRSTVPPASGCVKPVSLPWLGHHYDLALFGPDAPRQSVCLCCAACRSTILSRQAARCWCLCLLLAGPRSCSYCWTNTGSAHSWRWVGHSLAVAHSGSHVVAALQRLPQTLDSLLG
jgi:hypothetical protein